MRVSRALLSVSDKTGLVEFARGLIELGVELLSTGGTAAAIREACLPVTAVEDATGFPEMLDGRVKTLHPAIHGGILADRSRPDHLAAIHERGIQPIDLVVANLYPFRETVARPDVAQAEAIENIDIGGPAMIRSAAKNHGSVAVVVDPGDYAALLLLLRAGDRRLDADCRTRLAVKAFAHTAAYDAAIYSYLEGLSQGRFPGDLFLHYERVQTLRYGENPHQQAAFYRQPNPPSGTLAGAKLLSGQELSYVNLLDLDGALDLAREFSEPAAVIVKHANPCGCATAPSLAEAFSLARDADPMSRFGGIIALNRPCDRATAAAITVKNSFYHCLIAPGYEADALDLVLGRKGWGANIRVLDCGPLPAEEPGEASALRVTSVSGGLLAQTADRQTVADAGLKVVTDRAPAPEETAALLFAWRVVKHVKSNAIALARRAPSGGLAMVSAGMGQPNRVWPVEQAVAHAGDARGCVLASDAYFPKPDGPEAAAAAGVTAIIQPGGSVEDAAAIEVCNRHGIAMVFTGVRAFRH